MDRATRWQLALIVGAILGVWLPVWWTWLLAHWRFVAGMLTGAFIYGFAVAALDFGRSLGYDE